MCDKLSDTFKYTVVSGNHQMTMTMMELYDIIVGYEVEEDFTEENREHIRRLSKTVLAWVQKKLPGETLSNVNFSISFMIYQRLWWSSRHQQ